MLLHVCTYRWIQTLYIVFCVHRNKTFRFLLLRFHLLFYVLIYVALFSALPTTFANGLESWPIVLEIFGSISVSVVPLSHAAVVGSTFSAKSLLSRAISSALGPASLSLGSPKQPSGNQFGDISIPPSAAKDAPRPPWPSNADSQTWKAAQSENRTNSPRRDRPFSA